MRVELAKVDLKRGISERETTACDNYPEEWPKVFIFHGARGDTNVVQVMRENNAALIRIDRGFESVSSALAPSEAEKSFRRWPENENHIFGKSPGPTHSFRSPAGKLIWYFPAAVASALT